MTLAVVGQPTPQIEGVAKVSGKAPFAADVLIPGTLTCRILRSPYPHAAIRKIETSRARALAGVHAVITGADIPEALFGRRVQDMPVLARDKVRFVGERVAAVAAESKEIAEEAINLIEVEYEALPGVFDPLEAMKPDAPEVHPSVAAYRNHLEPVPETKNTFAHQVRTKGDVDAGFAQADRVFEHSFRTQSHHQGYLEPHAAVVHIGDDGIVQVWECNKQPLAGRAQLAHLTGLRPEQIVVHAVHMGADFGGKGSIMDTAAAYWLAKASGRPVRAVMSYTEELTAANPRNPGVITMKTGVKDDGGIVAHHSVCVWNTGAYSAFLPAGIVGGGLWAAGLYRVPHVKFENIGVYTNCTPRGHVRAPGAPQVAFALESHVDMMAHALGIDPVEFRMRNLIETGEESALGEPFEDLHAKETLAAAAKAAGWAEAPGAGWWAPRLSSLATRALVGRGVTMYDRHTGSGMATVELVVGRDGHAVLYTAAPDTGTGNHTIMQQIIAEELGLPLSQVAIRMSDSVVIPEDTGVGGSRVTHVYGLACQQAAREARERLQAAPGEEVRVRVKLDGPRPEGIASVCAQIAEVEVDPDTGGVKVRRIVTAHDVGTVINPMYHQGQIDGGVIYGLGFALQEELLIEDGKVLNPNLGEYKLPNIADIPPLETVLVTGAHGPTPYGGKAVGEMGNVPLAAAIANAVYNACGVRITELPITAEKVYRGLRGKA